MSRRNAITQPSMTSNEIHSLKPLSILRTETALSRFPIHNLSKKDHIAIRITKNNIHGEVELRWSVLYHPTYGQPGPLAYKLDTLVINRRLEEAGRPIPEIICLNSLRDVARELTLGHDTPLVRTVLRQNAHAVISAHITYTDITGRKRTATFESTRYGVIFTGERLPDGKKADAVYLVLNPLYRQILNSAPTRPLDYDYLKALTPAAQRFYELVSYKMFAALKYRIPQATLLYSDYCLFAPQQRYPVYDQVKKQMYKLHRPHILAGYVAKVRYEVTHDSFGQPDWRLCYTPGPKAYAEYASFNVPSANEPLPATVDTLLPPLALSQGVPPISSSLSPAYKVVAQFYRRFYGMTESKPLSKDLEYAEKVLAEHNEEAAQEFIEFSYHEAQKTHYQPQTFGGVMHYLGRFQARALGRAAQVEAQTTKALRAHYDVWRRDELVRLWALGPPELLETFAATVRARLTQEDAPPDFTLSLVIRAETEDLLAEHHQVPTFDTWCHMRSVSLPK